ncbi:hypothetical protein VRU48_14800 [Pedobacter sp. KR3-3]|uniref:Transposon-encoded protein TnpW n=1 Tax=Pedobacter albus TaxID=3113905 RepID=A0ABU7IA92_9SPHI|nr:hypothetical protein [Pedobacter sp. KR3-3]MEE1946390.1 hypothetical protein [Pedobacter sp. KR3-3]
MEEQAEKKASPVNPTESEGNRPGWTGKTDTINKEHPAYELTDGSRKRRRSKKKGKVYRVIVTYIPVTTEEAKIKLAIIESILKKSCKK